MKRQAIAFFTMFSLVMMLSIYYITLPDEDATVNSKDTSVVAKLNERTDENKKDETEKNNEIISDPEADEQKKSAAIIENEKIKENEKLQNECVDAIKKVGYESHVEIKEKTVYITILNQKEDAEIVTKTLKSCFPIVGNDFFLEVSFK